MRALALGCLLCKEELLMFERCEYDAVRALGGRDREEEDEVEEEE